MALYTNPNSPFEATFDSVLTGGVGQFRISIIDTPNSAVFLEPTTEGITERPPGPPGTSGGIYAWAGTSPPVTGQYTIYWDDGGTFGNPPEILAVEDLVVTGQPVITASVNQGVVPATGNRTGQTHIVDMKNVGPPSTPQEIKRQRRQAGDLLRRYGQPIIHRHMYTLDDVDKGVAKKCPSCFDEAYSQVRNDCPVCFSIGFVSTEDDTERFLDSNGNYTYSSTDVVAPKYGGFAEPVLTLIVQPDVPIDLFKINDRGVLTRVEQAQAFTYFNPYFADNDLLIMVEISIDGYTIRNILDYYQAKNANQHTIRGWGKRVRNQNQHVISQSFEMAMVPPNNILHSVSPGSVSYGVI